MTKFQIGDLCITQDATAGMLNSGLAVAILDFYPGQSESGPPHHIRRLVGQPILGKLAPITCAPHYFSGRVAWPIQYKSRRATKDQILAFLEQTTPLPKPVETGVGA